MTAIEAIQSAQRASLVDEDGDAVVLSLLPALEPQAIAALEQEVGMALPGELRTLLGFCSGIEGAGPESIDFTGASFSVGAEEVFPHGLPIAADGFGNHWMLDLTPQNTKVAPVFFHCHDAPVVLFQSADLASFLVEIFRMSTPPHQSLVNDVHDDRLFEVWRKNPGALDQPTAAVSSDPVLSAFAASLPAHFQVIDLRKASPGMGFSWGRYGPRTELRRHGHERIFAYAKPPSGGFWSRLFGC
jgi:cell wall assembly regulator SMI1